MTKTKGVDFLIVGQGLAGTFVAHELDKRGYHFVVIDPGKALDGVSKKPIRGGASWIAAGMMNPVVLKRFSPVWQGRQQIAKVRRTAAELAAQLAVKLDYPFDVLRIFHDDNERKTWQKKAALPALDSLLEKTFLPSPDDNIIAPLGVGKVNLTGKLDLTVLLSAYRQALQQRDQLLVGQVSETKFAENDVIVDYVSHAESATGNITAKQVIFCEGYGLIDNPFFRYLPLKGNKGEVLTVRIPGLRLTAAVKAAAFLMPLPTLGDDIYLLGATYNWTDKDELPTASARDELLEKLRNCLSPTAFATVEVLEHRAAMRPTVIDRRPLLGRHPQYPSLYVLNGLGTRGVMLGATMAALLVDFIVDGKTLPPEVDIARFCNAFTLSTTVDTLVI